MCNAFAVSMARYIYELNDSGNTKLFSPAYIYANRGASDYKGEGMITRQSLSCLTKNGVCYLGSFSALGLYNVLSQEYNSKKKELDKEAYPYRITSYYALYNDNEIKQAIITSGCVVAAYNVYDNWYRTGSDGKVGNNYGKNYGGHCILIVGWTKNNEWIILNSWGRTWGDGGLGYVPMSTQKNEAWCLVDNVQEVFFNSLKDCEDHWAKTTIDKAVQQGIIKGYEDGTFRPDSAIMRAEACAIIAKIRGYKEGEFIATPFSDISSSEWYSNYVGYCVLHNLVTGYGDGNFKPYNNLTRAEASKILCLLGMVRVKPEINGTRFSDVSTNHWAIRFINAMYDNGYINGYEDGSFKPSQNITRAEFISVIDKLGLLDK